MASPFDRSSLNTSEDLIKCEVRREEEEGEMELPSPVMELDRLDRQTFSHLQEWSQRLESEDMQPSCSSFSSEWSPTSQEDEEELGRTVLEKEYVDSASSQFEDEVEDEEELTDYENQGIVDHQARVEQGREDEERQCWVCFASEEDDPVAAWVHPCLCKGTTKWVHQVCLQRWVDEKQKGNNTAGVSCPQCSASYTIQFPASGAFLTLLDALDKLVGRLCPVVAGGVCVGSLYWTCVTYGDRKSVV